MKTEAEKRTGVIGSGSLLQQEGAEIPGGLCHKPVNQLSGYRHVSTCREILNNPSYC